MLNSSDLDSISPYPTPNFNMSDVLDLDFFTNQRNAKEKERKRKMQKKRTAETVIV